MKVTASVSEIRALVTHLGGPAKVARHLGIGTSAICNWYRLGIPARHHLPLWRLARERGVPWAPPDAEGLPPPSSAASVVERAA